MQNQVKLLAESIQYQKIPLGPKEVRKAFHEYTGEVFKTVFPKPEMNVTFVEYLKDLFLKFEQPEVAFLEESNEFVFIEKNVLKPKKKDKKEAENNTEEQKEETSSGKSQIDFGGLEKEANKETEPNEITVNLESANSQNDKQLKDPIKRQLTPDGKTCGTKIPKPDNYKDNFPSQTNLFNRALRLLNDVKVSYKRIPTKMIQFYTNMIMHTKVIEVEKINELSLLYGRNSKVNPEKYGFSTVKELLLSIPGFVESGRVDSNVIVFKPDIKENLATQYAAKMEENTTEKCPRVGSKTFSDHPGNDTIRAGVQLDDKIIKSLEDAVHHLHNLMEETDAKFIEHFFKTMQNEFNYADKTFTGKHVHFDLNNNSVTPKFENYEKFVKDFNKTKNHQAIAKPAKTYQTKNKLTREICVERYKFFEKMEQLAVLSLSEMPNMECDIALINRLISRKRCEILTGQGKNTKSSTYSTLHDVMQAVGTDKLEDVIDVMRGIKLVNGKTVKIIDL